MTASRELTSSEKDIQNIPADISTLLCELIARHANFTKSVDSMITKYNKKNIKSFTHSA